MVSLVIYVKHSLRNIELQGPDVIEALQLQANNSLFGGSIHLGYIKNGLLHQFLSDPVSVYINIAICTLQSNILL
jgi:hypothetical protein